MVTQDFKDHWWSIDDPLMTHWFLMSGLKWCAFWTSAVPRGNKAGTTMWRVHLEHNSVHAEHWKTLLDKWHCGLWRRRSEDFPNVPDQLGPNMKLLTAIRKMKLQTLCAFTVVKCIQMPKYLNQRSVEVGSALISCSLTGSSAKIHAHFGIMIPLLHRLHHGFRSKTKFFQWVSHGFSTRWGLQTEPCLGEVFQSQRNILFSFKPNLLISIVEGFFRAHSQPKSWWSLSSTELELPIGQHWATNSCQ